MNYRIFNPAILFLVVWGAALTLAGLCAVYQYDLRFVALYLYLNDVKTIFSEKSVLWGVGSVVAFAAGGLIARYRHVVSQKAVVHKAGFAAPHPVQLRRTIWVMFALFAVIGTITTLWMMTSIAAMGGIGGLRQAMNEAGFRHASADAWRANKLFIGARLLFSTMIGFAIFATAARTLINRFRIPVGRAAYRAVNLTLAGSLFLMFVIPALTAQRLLFGFVVIGCVATYLLVSARRFRPLHMALAFAGCAVIWVLVEAIGSRAIIDGTGVSPYSLAAQKFLFYFGNNIANMTGAVDHADGYHTYGFMSFRAALQFLAVDELIGDQLFASRVAYLDQFRGGGNFTVLGALYMDFGPFSLIVLFLMGYAAYRIYDRARRDFFMAQVYGVIAPTIVFSFHTEYYAHPNFWMNIALLVAINKFVAFAPVKRPTHGPATASPPVGAFTPAGPPERRPAL